jgi:hypothetical protein
LQQLNCETEKGVPLRAGFFRRAERQDDSGQGSWLKVRGEQSEHQRVRSPRYQALASNEMIPLLGMFPTAETRPEKWRTNARQLQSLEDSLL